MLCCRPATAFVTLRAGVPVTGEELDIPRSVCGANPLPTIDECATVVVSGWEAAWDVTAELTGVVVTGWLGTALPVTTAAAFAGTVAVFTGSFNADANDGVSAAGPLVARPEKPGENGPAEYGR